MAYYSSSAGSKLEYSVNGTTWTPMVGLKSIPAIGAKPNAIDTTTLDNVKYETNVNGLMPAPELEFSFNMEDPRAEANIAVAYGMAQDKQVREWKITYANGVTHTYSSAVNISFDELPVNEIAKFTMYHAPVSEIVTTIPAN